MTSLPIMGPMAQATQAEREIKVTHQGAAPER